MRRFFLFLICIGALFGGLVGPVVAATVISPIVELSVAPGETQTGVVKLYNETNQVASFVAEVEAFTTSAITGSPVYIPANEQNAFLNWIALEQSDVVLQPGQAVIVPFTITVPTTAVPGGYYAVVFWREVSSAQNQVAVQSRVGTLIFITVTGEVNHALSVVQVTAKTHGGSWPVEIKTELKNDGNVHERPNGTATINGWLGQQTVALNTDGRYVLPQTTRELNTIWSPSMFDFFDQLRHEFVFMGKTNITVEYTYGVDQVVGAPVIGIFFIPYRLLTVFGVVIVGFGLYRRLSGKIKKMRNQHVGQ